MSLKRTCNQPVLTYVRWLKERKISTYVEFMATVTRSLNVIPHMYIAEKKR